ncbi:hypothetical protein LY474_32235 [Myxococcus stipitatus]|uniref:hypothetical protein n=1 Tax=Myxococcus stipitatus TaxID=83455 RepID=UPI001F221804|nr:hypothetical protein [Myxococcus stipitatus]MCE9672487.1 hypothetical protein [Myxococcus stipitatus]
MKRHPSPLVVLAVLCASLPAIGFAQDAPIQAPPPVESLQAPPLVSAPDVVEDAPLVVTPDEGARESALDIPRSPPPAVRPARRPWRMPQAARLAIETAAGSMGSTGAGFLGLIPGVLLADNCDGLVDDSCAEAWLTGGAGMAIGATLGVYFSGTIMKERGSFWSTLMGAIVGAGSGVLTFAAFDDTNDGLAVLGLLALPPVGAVIGYELGLEPHPSELATMVPATGAASTVRLIPSVGSTRHGGIMGGIVGSF